MGLLQGATELFPVSSLGHAVILPALLHWSYRQSDPSFVPFLTLLHLGTAGALLILYWRDWAGIIRGFFRAALRGRIAAPEERLSMLLLVATVPAGAVGLLLEAPLKQLFATPRGAGPRLPRRKRPDPPRRRGPAPTFGALRRQPPGAGGAVQSGGTDQLPGRGHNRCCPGPRAPAWHLSFRGHDDRRSAGRASSPGGGTVLIPPGDPRDHGRRRAGGAAAVPQRRAARTVCRRRGGGRRGRLPERPLPDQVLPLGPAGSLRLVLPGGRHPGAPLATLDRHADWKSTIDARPGGSGGCVRGARGPLPARRDQLLLHHHRFPAREARRRAGRPGDRLPRWGQLPQASGLLLAELSRPRRSLPSTD